jgi:site-specific DNA-methyltransferase (adenine-specific)
MGDDYIDYVQSIVEAEGYEATSWNNIESGLQNPSALWDEWAGNRKNFRKPGTKKK